MTATAKKSHADDVHPPPILHRLGDPIEGQPMHMTLRSSSREVAHQMSYGTEIVSVKGLRIHKDMLHGSTLVVHEEEA